MGWFTVTAVIGPAVLVIVTTFCSAVLLRVAASIAQSSDRDLDAEYGRFCAIRRLRLTIPQGNRLDKDQSRSSSLRSIAGMEPLRVADRLIEGAATPDGSTGPEDRLISSDSQENSIPKPNHQ